MVWRVRRLAPTVLVCGAGAIGCGDRTGLLVPAAVDAGSSPSSRDAASLVDAPVAKPDGPAQLPPVHVVPRPTSAPPLSCADSGTSSIYTITTASKLLRFDPPTRAFTLIGTPSCGDATNPFSMAVNDDGIAFVAYKDGRIFHVSTVNAACAPTSFMMNQQGFPTRFGMGFSQDGQAITETLFVAGDTTSSSGDMSPSLLGAIDPRTLQLTRVGPFNPAIYGPELSGTSAGELFAFYQKQGQSNLAAIGQIDKATGNVVAESLLPNVSLGQAWAFAFWGGDFYTFTSPDPPGTETLVQRFRPSDGTVVTVARTPFIIDGAGVSTCAPQQ